MLRGSNLIEAAGHYFEMRNRGSITDLVCFQRILMLNEQYALAHFHNEGLIFLKVLEGISTTSVHAKDIKQIICESHSTVDGYGDETRIVDSLNLCLSFFCFPDELYDIHQELYFVHTRLGYKGFEYGSGYDPTELDRLNIVLTFDL